MAPMLCGSICCKARLFAVDDSNPLFTINLDGKITDMNNASVTITGVEREELTGTDFFNYS